MTTIEGIRSTPHRAVVARRLQRQLGISRRALSPPGRVQFDLVADVYAKLEALDRAMQERRPFS